MTSANSAAFDCAHQNALRSDAYRERVGCSPYTSGAGTAGLATRPCPSFCMYPAQRYRNASIPIPATAPCGVPNCARTRPVWRCSSPFASADKHHVFRHASICIAGTQHPCKHKRVPRAHHCTRQKKGQTNMGSNHHHPKTAVIVDVVVRVIPVASGTARVVYCVSPRAATHHLSRPPDQVLPLGICIIALIFSCVFPRPAIRIA